MNKEKFLVPDCVACPLSEKRLKIVQGQGSLNPRVLFVGQHSNTKEDETGKAFTGHGGRLLLRALEKVGLDKNVGVLASNAVRCISPPKQTVPSVAIKECRHWMEEEIVHYQPELVVLLGDIALQSILHKKGVFVNRGIFQNHTIKSSNGDWSGTVLSTLHPNAILAQPENEYIFEADLGKAKRWLEGFYRDRVETKVVIVDRDGVQKLADYLTEKGRFAFDIESTGLDWWIGGDDILCFSFCAEPGLAYVIPIRGQFNVPYLADNEEDQARIFGEILDIIWEPLNTCKVVGQNIGFDKRFTSKFGL